MSFDFSPTRRDFVQLLGAGLLILVACHELPAQVAGGGGRGNRGGGVGKARVQMFASLAATLITPERWVPIGSVEMEEAPDGIPQGDTLRVSGAHDWVGALATTQAVGGAAPKWPPESPVLRTNLPAQPLSFLAVLRPEDAPPSPFGFEWATGLPPGPIGNPGEEALRAALDPTSDGWMYFVATDGVNKTEFAETHDEFLKLKDKFNAS